MKLRSHFPILAFVVCAFLVAFNSLHVHGQGTDLGTIRGVVTDSSGAVVPNASVTIVDTSTNAERRTNANGQGEYQVFGLRSGSYKVSISATGFTTHQIDNVVLNGSSIVGVNATLRVSSAQEKIEVTVGIPAIDTENATISDTIGHDAVIDLPRDSRNVYDFLYLNPNITQADEPGDFKFIGFQSYGASFSVDGQRSNGGIFGAQTASAPSLEAVDEVNVLSNNFSADYAGIANIRITTKRGTNAFHGSMFYNNKNSALGAWTVQDKIGKSQFQPSAFESKFPNPFFNVNDLGGALGGPIPKLRNTWFFMAYERDYNVAPVDIQSSTLPHPDLYTGNFSQMSITALPDVPAGLGLTSQEIANDTVIDGSGHELFTQIPSRLLNPTVQNLINTYFPHVGLGVPIAPKTGRILGGFETLLPGRDTVDQGTLRLDHDFSEKDHVYVTYNASAENSATSPVVAAYTGLGLRQNIRQNHTVGLSFTRVIKPNLVNEARGGFNKENSFTHSNTTLEGFLSGIGFDPTDIAAYGSVVGPFALSTFGHPAINFNSAFATFSNGGRNTDRPKSTALTTFGDTLTWVAGKHNLKFGGDAVRNWAIDGFVWNRGNPRGSMTYKGPPNGCNIPPCSKHKVDSFSDFLLGLQPTTASYVVTLRPPMDVHNWEQGYFVQDDWKLNSSITVNLGLRYDLITPFIDKNDLMVNFAPNLTNPVSGQPGVFVIPSTKTLPFLDTRIVGYGYVTAAQSKLGIGRGLVRTDKNNFAPRIGIAWAIGDKSVVRGGYGIFYPTSAAQGVRDPMASTPFNQGATASSLPNGWPGFAHGFSPINGGTLAAFGNAPSANAVPIGLQEPRIQQYNATFERQLGWDSAVRFSYLGAHMGGLIAGRDLNELAPSSSGFATTTGDGISPCDPINNGDCALSTADLAQYPFPIIGENLLTYGNFARGNSNAFQAQFERRYKKGLLLNVSYTYLDQKSTIGDTANSSLGSVGYNIFNFNNDYATDGFVSRHRLVAYGIYDLPVGHGHTFGQGFSKFVDTLLGSWQTTFQMFAKSGTGYTPFWVCDDCDPVLPGNIGSTSVDAVGDFGFPDFRPTILGHNLYTGQSGSNATIWNAAAFGVPSIGADFFNNPTVAKRNILMGPALWGVNLGVHKNFKVTERVTASLGADVNNLFNHPLLAPDLNDGGGSCGQGCFANVGDFSLDVDNFNAPPPGQQPSLVPITATAPPDPTKSCPFSTGPCYFEYNPAFGKLIKSYQTEGVSASRQVRLRLRITF
jgi:Carboxypeptidase regulatory-like domain